MRALMPGAGDIDPVPESQRRRRPPLRPADRSHRHREQTIGDPAAPAATAGRTAPCSPRELTSRPAPRAREDSQRASPLTAGSQWPAPYSRSALRELTMQPRRFQRARSTRAVFASRSDRVASSRTRIYQPKLVELGGTMRRAAASRRDQR
jgi:hypothetical protein